MAGHHLAQFNIARAAFDDPAMADFVAQLDRVNALAEASPGFVWRMKSEDGRSSSYLQAYDDPCMLVNMSLWASAEALRGFVFRGDHAGVMAQRKRWFEAPAGPVNVLWWVPEGALPTAQEGRAKLAELAAKGPGPAAFTFQRPFPPP